MSLHDAWLNARNGRLAQAEKNLDQIGTRAIGNATWLAARAHILDRLDKNDAAQADRKAALAFDPNYLLAHVDLGREAMKQGNALIAGEHLALALGRFQSDRFLDSGRVEIDAMLVPSDDAFKRAVELRPDNGQLWVARGRHLAWKGRFQEASQAYLKGIEPQSIWSDWLECASVCVLADNLDGYRHICALLKERLDHPNEFPRVWSDSQILPTAARIASLHPDSGIAPDQIMQWAMQAYRGEGRSHMLYAVAAAELNAGEYQNCIESAMKSIAESPTWPANHLNWSVLAMAHQRLGHQDEARQFYARSDAALSDLLREAAKTEYPPQNYWIGELLEGQAQRVRALAVLQSEATQNESK